MDAAQVVRIRPDGRCPGIDRGDALRGARASSAGGCRHVAAWAGPFRIDAQAPFVQPYAADQISCPTTTFCASADDHGNVITTTDPAGSSAWQVTPIAAVDDLTGMSCPTASFCVATGMGLVATSTDPTGGVGAWTKAEVDGTRAPRTSAVRRPRSARPSTAARETCSPAPIPGGAGAWSITKLPVTVASAISCASASLCVASDTQGDVFTSTDPTEGAGAWTKTYIDVGNINDIGCPTVSFCAVVSSGGLTFATDPTGGASAWSTTTLPALNGWEGISCTTDLMCVIVDSLATPPSPPIPLAAPARGRPRSRTVRRSTASTVPPPRCAWPPAPRTSPAPPIRPEAALGTSPSATGSTRSPACHALLPRSAWPSTGRPGTC